MLKHAVRRSSASSEAVLLSVGILGATVMPHVIYLHSALTQDRLVPETDEDAQTLLRYTRVDVVIAMTIAGLINVAMLVMAASTFFQSGLLHVDSLEGAHKTLEPILGGASSVLFALALLASGLSSSAVGTLSGQVVMQGFIRRQIPLAVRRLVTMVPAFVVIAIGIDPSRTLVISQVVLSFGIPFALVPLVIFTARRDIMGPLVNRRITTVAASAIAAVIVALNIFLLLQTVGLVAQDRCALPGAAASRLSGDDVVRISPIVPGSGLQNTMRWTVRRNTTRRDVLAEVAERVDRVAVDPHLEVEVRPEAVAGTADVTDHVALAHLLAARDRDRALMAVGGREVAAVVDHHEVAVALLPAAVDDRAAGGGVDRRAVADADVDPLVHPSPAPAERARDRPLHRPDQPRVRRCLRRAAVLRLRGADLRSDSRARRLERVDLLRLRPLGRGQRGEILELLLLRRREIVARTDELVAHRPRLRRPRPDHRRLARSPSPAAASSSCAQP